MRSLTVLSGALVLLVSLHGCIAVGGRSDVNEPTLGHQMLDLKAALDAGAITQIEFDQAKARLLAAHRPDACED